MNLLMANRGLIRGAIAADPFQFTINTALGVGDDFQLPLPSGQTYNFVVNWGDGNEDTITAYNQAETLHAYTGAFNGQISITGKCGGWSFNNLGDKLKVTSVDNWGDVGFDYTLGGFYGCTNLVSISSDNLISSGVNAMQSLFRNTGITSIPSGIFDLLSNATNAFATFLGSKITSIPNELFRYNTAMNQAAGTFQECTDLIGIGEDIFYYNLIISYNATFNSCKNMVLPTRMFNTANLSIATTFDNFMLASIVGNSSTGTIQDIWNYALSATSLDAFLNQTTLTNYAAIPNAWKGL